MGTHDVVLFSGLILGVLPITYGNADEDNRLIHEGLVNGTVN